MRRIAATIRRARELALERARLLKLGFVWPALLFGPLWLVARGVWRALALWVLGAALLATAAKLGLVGAGGVLWLYALSALYLALEGRALQGAALTRGGQPLVDIVCAGDAASAERTFFARAVAGPPPLPPRRAADLAADPPAGAPPHVLGMFPEAGG